MTFPLSPSSPFVSFTSVITAAFLNGVRVAVNEALDGTAGGTYTPSPQLAIGGAGLKLFGGTALELDATSICTQDAGGVFNFNGTLNVDNAGFIEILNGGTLEVQNGGEIELDAGSTLFVEGHINIAGANGQLLISSGGTLDVLLGGVLKIENGANLNVFGGLDIESTGALQVSPSGAIIGNAGSQLTWAGDANMTGTQEFADVTSATRTGPLTLSGASARTKFRITHLNSDSNLSIEPSQWDVIDINTSGFTADRTWTFQAPPGNVPCMIFISTQGSAGTHNLTVNSANGTLMFHYNTGSAYSGGRVFIYDVNSPTATADWYQCG